MKFIAKLLLPIFKNYVIELITKEDNKTFVVSKISQYISFPNISEEEEKQIINKIYDAVAEITKTYLGK